MLAYEIYKCKDFLYFQLQIPQVKIVFNGRAVCYYYPGLSMYNAGFVASTPALINRNNIISFKAKITTRSSDSIS
jgi:hypothetical protein